MDAHELTVVTTGVDVVGLLVQVTIAVLLDQLSHMVRRHSLYCISLLAGLVLHQLLFLLLNLIALGVRFPNVLAQLIVIEMRHNLVMGTEVKAEGLAVFIVFAMWRVQFMVP